MVYHTLKSDNIEIFLYRAKADVSCVVKKCVTEKSAPGKGWHHSVMDSLGSQELKTVPNFDIPFSGVQGQMAKFRPDHV